ncbi:MAG: GAF domain-containing protein [Synergistaceae bacterium]|jgi:GAF domain-containing protein|nr:GAF domain-containing protein [Synergistaceae bacterium]
MILEMEDFKNKNEMYAHLDSACAAVIDRRDDVISSLSNASSLIKKYLIHTNWVGFYLFRGEILTLGPFQGEPAVTSIKLGKGLCGMAAQEKKTVRVDDVAACDNYIACDASSASEIVIPLLKKDRVLGVLDIDSTMRSRFDKDDERGLEKIASSLVRLIYM